MGFITLGRPEVLALLGIIGTFAACIVFAAKFL